MKAKYAALISSSSVYLFGLFVVSGVAYSIHPMLAVICFVLECMSVVVALLVCFIAIHIGYDYELHPIQKIKSKLCNKK